MGARAAPLLTNLWFGVLDAKTAGLASRAAEGAGHESFVDKDSLLYQLGQLVGSLGGGKSEGPPTPSPTRIAPESGPSLEAPPDTSAPTSPTPQKSAVKTPGPTVDPLTGKQVGRFVVDPKGNAMIEPAGGSTQAAGRGGVDTHTTYPNGSNYQRLNPQGHGPNGTPHGHGHLEGTGPNMAGQGPSISPSGGVVPRTSPAAHWPIK